MRLVSTLLGGFLASLCGAQVTIVNPAPGDRESFGESVAIKKGVAVIAASFDPDYTGKGAIYVYEKSSTPGSTWATATHTVLTASDGVSGDLLGNGGDGVDIADQLSEKPNEVEKHIVVAGAAFKGMAKGAVYVFEKTGAAGSETWQAGKTLDRKDTEAGLRDYFGLSVGIASFQSQTPGAPLQALIVAGAPGRGASAGAAYIFSRQVAGFERLAGTITNSPESGLVAGATENERFGEVVAVGARRLAGGGCAFDVVVSAPKKDRVGLPAAGEVYVYTTHDFGANFLPKRTLVARNSIAGDLNFKEFGKALAISGDVLAVGAGSSEPPPKGVDEPTGLVHVFQRSTVNGNDQWVEVVTLGKYHASAGDHFGTSVAVSFETLVVGSMESVVAGEATGAAYVFRSPEDPATGNWGTSWWEVDKLHAAESLKGDQQGSTRVRNSQLQRLISRSFATRFG